MKKTIAIILMICALIVFPAAGCKNKGADSSASVGQAVEISAQDVTVKQASLDGYDFTALFTIAEGGKSVPVLAEYIDSSGVKTAAGTYMVICSYKGVQKGALVTVQKSAYSVQAALEEVSVRKREVESYDFKSLFTVTADGERREISDDMVTTAVKAETGDYDYTVSYGGESATITVHVTENRIIEIIPAYFVYELEVDDIATFDPTVLFSLYLDGEVVRVTEDMIDASALNGAEAGHEYKVTLTYSADDVVGSGSANVKVVPHAEITITAKNITTYPNAPAIDLTTLFTIEKGGKEIPVTIDMISGEIDYTLPESEITLTYGEKSAVAKVTVTNGVIIDYAKADTVMVRRGTDKYAYNYAGDFIVIINGLRQYVIPDTCFDLSGVNFDSVGTCTATLSINYNDQPANDPTSPPTLTPVTKEITYVVTDYAYSVSVAEENVVLPAGTTEYNAFSNVSLSINGVRQGLVSVKEYADAISTYAEVSEIDFGSSAPQTVTVTIYPAGRDGDFDTKFDVTFTLTVLPDVTVTCLDRIVFEEATLYARDLFTVTENGKQIKTTDDMIEGRVDTFVSGVYTVTAEYKGVKASCRVVVYPREFVGTYKTRLSLIPQEEEDDDDEGLGGWGGGGGDIGGREDSPEYSVMATAATATPTYVGQMVIDESGLIAFDGHTSYAIRGVDESTMEITLTNGDIYTLHYYDGVVVLDVDNTLRTAFSDYKRPLIYVNTDVYRLRDIVTINSSDKYVLTDNYSSDRWSLDALGYSRIEGDDSILWYGLYVKLVTHTSIDTIYQVKWGEVAFDEGFVNAANKTSALTFDGEKITFTLSAKGVGKAAKTGITIPDYVPTNGKVAGEVDGVKNVVLSFTRGSDNVNFTLQGGSINFSGSLSYMKRGGFGLDNTVFLYSSSGNDASTVYSYKMQIDKAAKSFTVLPRDKYFGKYVCGTRVLFLDGYGGGEFFEVNENGSSTNSADITYTVHGNEIAVSFHSLNPVYSYGKKASFYVSQLLNVLTVKSSDGDALAGMTFENVAITDGAIVRAPAFLLLDGGSLRDQILNAVTIITAEGELTGTKKNNAIKTTSVYNASCFSLYTITVKVGGKDVTMRYTVQVVKETLAGDAVALLTGTADGRISVNIKSSGAATIAVDSATYSGTATLTDGGNRFVVKAYSTTDNMFISASGVKAMDGVYYVTFDGALRSSDWFHSGNVTVKSAAGRDGTLRKFTSGTGTIYVLSDSASLSGRKVEVQEENGNGGNCTVTDGENVFTAEVKWDNLTDGYRKIAAAV